MQLHKANKNLIGINKVTAKVLEITVLDSQLGLAARLKLNGQFILPWPWPEWDYWSPFIFVTLINDHPFNQKHIQKFIYYLTSNS